MKGNQALQIWNRKLSFIIKGMFYWLYELISGYERVIKNICLTFCYNVLYILESVRNRHLQRFVTLTAYNCMRTVKGFSKHVFFTIRQ